jgi:hypothetical protein
LPIADTGSRHENTARSSTITVHAPHCPRATAEFSTVQLQRIAQCLEQRRGRIDIEFVLDAVNG